MPKVDAKKGNFEAEKKSNHSDGGYVTIRRLGATLASTSVTNPLVHVVWVATHVLQMLHNIVANDDNYALAA